MRKRRGNRRDKQVTLFGPNRIPWMEEIDFSNFVMFLNMKLTYDIYNTKEEQL